MCVVSMVMDHYWEKWAPQTPAPMPPAPYYPPIAPFVIPANIPTQEEIDEFRALLARAREYDRKHNEPDCDNEPKKKALKDLAKTMGIDISFVDER